MFSSADKVAKVTTVQRQSAQPFFARKHSDSFFSGESSAASPSAFIQPKLSVSHPEDAQEKEADHMAAKVMTMPDTQTVSRTADQKEEVNRSEDKKEDVHRSADKKEEVHRAEEGSVQRKEEGEEVSRVEEGSDIHRKEEEGAVQRAEEKKEEKVHTKLFASGQAGSSRGFVQAKCAGCDDEKKVHKKGDSSIFSSVIHRSSRGPPGDSEQHASFEQNLSNTRGTGTPMGSDTRSFMENRFSADFSGVRIHTNDTSVQMNKEINAQAFTYGNDIYFNSGKYSPSSTEGRTLLAHELTHTIQQGASNHVAQPANAAKGSATVAPKLISRKKSIQRSAGNLAAAVGFAKGEQGKVIANKEGGDGLRFGWQQLMEYFKTSLGKEKIVSGNGSGDPTEVAEGNIKKKNTAHGMNVIMPDGKVGVGDRDAMPSWCGIFAFWSLHKAGVPMKKWVLGKMTIPPDAAMPPGTAPQPGFIAYRNMRSHYGLVSSASGTKVTTVNGNTCGTDNLGGEIQEQTHDISNWTAFFDPMKMTDGAVRNPDAGVEGKPKSLRELQKEMFNVSRKEDEKGDKEAKVHAKSEPDAHATAGVPGGETGGKEELQRKEGKEDEVKPVSRKELIHTKSDDKGKEELQRKEEAKEEEKNVHRKVNVNSGGANAPPAQGGEIQCKTGDSDDKKDKMISASADSSPPAQKEEVHRMAGDSGLNRKEMIYTSSDSSPPAHKEEKETRGVQRKSEPKVQRLFGWISDAIEWVGDKLEEGKKWLLGKVKDLIINVPGYKALRVVLGADPISGETVERNGYNFIDAAIDLMPGGILLKRKLQELGILEQAALFAERMFGRVENLISGIYDTFANFFNSLSLSDLKDIPGVFRRLESAFTSFFDHIIDFAKGVAKDFLEFIKKALLIPLGTYIKTKTKFWDLLCLIIGKDPLTDEVKSPTGANILNAVLGISDQGIEQRKKMQETGTFNKVAAWIDRGIAVFSRAYDMLKSAFAGLWNIISIEALMHPVDTFLKIFDSFWQPISLVGKFFLDALIEILKIVKEVLFKWISNKAKETKGYFLVTVLIAKDPFTGDKVPRTTENLIKGFMLLSEGGEEQFNKMKESGAIDRATAKIDAAVATLNFTWEYVKGLFISLWESFTWVDLLVPLMAFVKIIDTFKGPILRLIQFIITVVVALFEVILRMMGFPVDLVFKLIDNVKKAWAMIKSNPTGFLMNLLRAIKQGFTQFFDNILTHLWNGLKQWLKNELADAGVPMPQDYTVMGIIKWLLAVLDITMEKIWKKLADRIGKEKVDKIRSLIAKAEAVYDKVNEAMEFIDDVRKRGMDAIVDKIKEKLENIWDMVLDAIKSFIMDQIIKKVTAKLLSMLDPTGIMAIINSAIALYKAIQSFIKYITKMLEIVNSFVEGIIEICTGNISSAANFLEGALAKGIPIVIGFLANQVGLDLSGRIREVLGTVREKVDKGLDFLIDKLVGFVEKLVAKAKDAKDKVLGWLGIRKELKTKDDVSHTIYFEGKGTDAKLMIATTPMTVKKYLTDDVKGAHGLKDADIQAPLKTAEEIEALEKAPNPDEAAKVNAMNEKILALATQIAALPLNTSTGVNSGIMFGPKYEEHGTSATVAFRKQPFTHGSIPTKDATGRLAKMNIRKNGGAPYYVKGHLLNENLGGLGSLWENLSPITYQANSDHKTQFENPVKMAVNGQHEGVNPDKKTHGYMKGFTVVAIYGRTQPDSLVKLTTPGIPVLPAGLKPEWSVPQLIEILTNEMYAPKKFVCSATFKGGKDTNETTISSKPIENEIYYGDLNQYQLGIQPRAALQISTLVAAKPKAANPAEMFAALSPPLNGITPAIAAKIYATFLRKKSITDGLADIGISLPGLNALNTGKDITSGTFDLDAAIKAADAKAAADAAAAAAAAAPVPGAAPAAPGGAVPVPGAPVPAPAAPVPGAPAPPATPVPAPAVPTAPAAPVPGAPAAPVPAAPGAPSAVPVPAPAAPAPGAPSAVPIPAPAAPVPTPTAPGVSTQPLDNTTDT